MWSPNIVSCWIKTESRRFPSLLRNERSRTLPPSLGSGTFPHPREGAATLNVFPPYKRMRAVQDFWIRPFAQQIDAESRAVPISLQVREGRNPILDFYFRRPAGTRVLPSDEERCPSLPRAEGFDCFQTLHIYEREDTRIE